MNSTPQPPNRRASGLIDAQIGACLFHNSSEGVFISDLHGIIQTVNPAFSRITGYAYEEAIGQRTSLLKSHHHHADFYTALWQVLSSTGHWQGEIWNRRKNGEVYLQQTHLNALTDEQGNTNGYLAQFNDITEMRRSNDHIHQLAYYDALTGLANRTLLHERLGHAASRCQRTHCQMAVLLLDIDRFKLVNETLGHDKGDQMLKEIAERLQQAIDPQTDTAGRLGGDEFLLSSKAPTTQTT